MTITYQFEVPQAPIPAQYAYRDGMRGLSGGIFDRRGQMRGGHPYGVAGLAGLGDAAADATAAAIAEFDAKSMMVRNSVLAASAQMIIYAPLGVLTFSNNAAHLDSIAAQVHAGNIGKIASWVQVADALISQAKDASAQRWWQNLPDVEESVEIIRGIPAKFAAAIVATAGVTGQAAGDLLRNAGVDPNKVLDTAGSTARWLGVGALGLAVIYLVSR